ncbi:RHS repeat-associated core domain-containing protein [Neisseria lactamica]|uniref:RHS repeat-associated core domain-containing protein n=1 Tax=Neisseria lactamica TaxID=486 RepID=UPI001EFDA9D7|nr:RHS repeat-associated core domain-containing protein [Neisseria lactamica]
MPTKEENAQNGLPETDWRDAQYDMLYLPVTETVRYHYDFNGNRTATVLPDGRQINCLYYGSGHLHQISLDDEVITDIERDTLHREIFRTQGKLASRYELDPLGRLERQIAALNELTEGGKGKTKVAAGYSQTAVKRSYGYDRTGNLVHSTDQRTGTTHFEFDRLGRITKAGSERFAFDPAHNILSDHNSPTVQDNRLKEYNGSSYYYDGFGNLIHRELADGEVQNYFYDLHDQLVKAEIFKKDGSKETWAYTYDALGRRIGKGRLKNEEVSDGLEEETGFVWDGSHLLQEVHPDGRYTYLYTDQDSYEPLAQVRNWTTEDGESRQQIHYFHCDQIGIPREMTDKDGNLVWFGDYYGWGKLRSETNVTGTTHQPFRLQNQYCDRETGLHYNFFRYYEPNIGRFVNQDPIGLFGGSNFYAFALNTTKWIDTLGWFKYHGNWCGPDWTGGREEQYSKLRDNNGYYAEPMGVLDTACRQHDICYAKCREQFSCSGLEKYNCMVRCDDTLVNTSKNIQHDPNSSSIKRWGLEKAISQHYGPENNTNTCQNPPSLDKTIKKTSKNHR